MPPMLRHYHNKRQHANLDRYAALDLLRYVSDGFVRTKSVKDERLLFDPLVEALTQERGIRCSVNADTMEVALGKNRVNVRIISDMMNKVKSGNELQYWEGEVEHNLPNVFSSVIGGLSQT